MRSLWNPDDRDGLRRRFATLTDDRAPQWGRMNCPQMVRHVTWAIQMATGERPVPPRNTPLRFFPIKQLILYVFPFPRSAPTAPDLIVRDTSTVEVERSALDRAIDVFVKRDTMGTWPPHPAFGAMTGDAWGALAFKHADHHLRQFGA